MAIPAEQLAAFKERVLAAKRPLIFYDDDGDGLCSFLLCLRARNGDALGVRVQASATLLAEFALRKVEENGPDLVIVLDKPYIEQAFLDACPVPVLWLDHHEPQKPTGNVTYLNPRIADNADNRCTTHWVWHALGREEDLWIAAVGSICDWQMTDIADAFRAKYPALLGNATTAPQVLYDQPFSELAALIRFNLKGDSSDVRTAIKVIGRIDSHEELLKHETPRARLLWKRYENVRREYDKMLITARKAASDDPVLLFMLHDVEVSLVGEMSNALIHEFPQKIIFIARDENGDVKLSIRSASLPVAPAVKAALANSGAHGNAGGHELACGGKIKSEDFPAFYQEFRIAMGFN